MGIERHGGSGAYTEEHCNAVRTLLELVGESDLDRPGIKETPRRVASAWLEMTWGARVNENQFLSKLEKTFPDEPCNEMISLTDIRFVSLCEHHVLPFMGTAIVSYIPKDNSVLGLSKIARLVEFYGARLQIQERMTRQIADALVKIINPLGVGVCLKAHHLCMEIRGARAAGAITTTTDLRGVIFASSLARQEFLSLTH